MAREIEQEKANRIAGDIILFGTGIIAIIAAIPSEGASLAGWQYAYMAFRITAGTFSAGSGFIKVILDVNGKFEESDKIPDGLGGTIGKVVGYNLGNEQLGEEIGSFAESVILLGGSFPTIKANMINEDDIKILDDMISIYNVAGSKSMEDLLKEIKRKIEDEMD